MDEKITGKVFKLFWNFQETGNQQKLAITHSKIKITAKKLNGLKTWSMENGKQKLSKCYLFLTLKWLGTTLQFRKFEEIWKNPLKFNKMTNF